MADKDSLRPEDRTVLEAVGRGGAWLRAVLCTLARRGVKFRREHPERAKAVLESLEPFPLYKGGQFLFDLMEWEDFMLDGPAPELVSTTLDAGALFELARFLEGLRRHIDGAAGAEADAPFEVAGGGAPIDEELPPLEPGLFLYRDVVLGIVRSAAEALPGDGDRDEGD